MNADCGMNEKPSSESVEGTLKSSAPPSDINTRSQRPKGHANQNMRNSRKQSPARQSSNSLNVPHTHRNGSSHGSGASTVVGVALAPSSAMDMSSVAANNQQVPPTNSPTPSIHEYNASFSYSQSSTPLPVATSSSSQTATKLHQIPVISLTFPFHTAALPLSPRTMAITDTLPPSATALTNIATNITSSTVILIPVTTGYGHSFITVPADVTYVCADAGTLDAFDPVLYPGGLDATLYQQTPPMTAFTPLHSHMVGLSSSHPDNPTVPPASSSTMSHCSSTSQTSNPPQSTLRLSSSQSNVSSMPSAALSSGYPHSTGYHAHTQGGSAQAPMSSKAYAASHTHMGQGEPMVLTPSSRYRRVSASAHMPAQVTPPPALLPASSSTSPYTATYLNTYGSGASLTPNHHRKGRHLTLSQSSQAGHASQPTTPLSSPPSNRTSFATEVRDKDAASSSSGARMSLKERDDLSEPLRREEAAGTHRGADAGVHTETRTHTRNLSGSHQHTRSHTRSHNDARDSDSDFVIVSSKTTAPGRARAGTEVSRPSSSHSPTRGQDSGRTSGSNLVRRESMYLSLRESMASLKIETMVEAINQEEEEEEAAKESLKRETLARDTKTHEAEQRRARDMDVEGDAEREIDKKATDNECNHTARTTAAGDDKHADKNDSEAGALICASPAPDMVVTTATDSPSVRPASPPAQSGGAVGSAPAPVLLPALASTTTSLGTSISALTVSPTSMSLPGVSPKVSSATATSPTVTGDRTSSPYQDVPQCSSPPPLPRVQTPPTHVALRARHSSSSTLPLLATHSSQDPSQRASHTLQHYNSLQTQTPMQGSTLQQSIRAPTAQRSPLLHPAHGSDSPHTSSPTAGTHDTPNEGQAAESMMRLCVVPSSLAPRPIAPLSSLRSPASIPSVSPNESDAVPVLSRRNPSDAHGFVPASINPSVCPPTAHIATFSTTPAPRSSATTTTTSAGSSDTSVATTAPSNADSASAAIASAAAADGSAGDQQADPAVATTSSDASNDTATAAPTSSADADTSDATTDTTTHAPSCADAPSAHIAHVAVDASAGYIPPPVVTAAVHSSPMPKQNLEEYAPAEDSSDDEDDSDDEGFPSPPAVTSTTSHVTVSSQPIGPAIASTHTQATGSATGGQSNHATRHHTHGGGSSAAGNYNHAPSQSQHYQQHPHAPTQSHQQHQHQHHQQGSRRRNNHNHNHNGYNNGSQGNNHGGIMPTPPTTFLPHSPYFHASSATPPPMADPTSAAHGHYGGYPPHYHGHNYHGDAHTQAHMHMSANGSMNANAHQGNVTSTTLAHTTPLMHGNASGHASGVPPLPPQAHHTHGNASRSATHTPQHPNRSLSMPQHTRATSIPSQTLSRPPSVPTSSPPNNSQHVFRQSSLTSNAARASTGGQSTQAHANVHNLGLSLPHGANTRSNTPQSSAMSMTRSTASPTPYLLPSANGGDTTFVPAHVPAPSRAPASNNSGGAGNNGRNNLPPHLAHASVANTPNGPVYFVSPDPNGPTFFYTYPPPGSIYNADSDNIMDEGHCGDSFSPLPQLAPSSLSVQSLSQSHSVSTSAMSFDTISTISTPSVNEMPTSRKGRKRDRNRERRERREELAASGALLGPVGTTLTAQSAPSDATAPAATAADTVSVAAVASPATGHMSMDQTSTVTSSAAASASAAGSTATSAPVSAGSPTPPTSAPALDPRNAVHSATPEPSAPLTSIATFAPATPAPSSAPAAAAVVAAAAVSDGTVPAGVSAVIASDSATAGTSATAVAHASVAGNAASTETVTATEAYQQEYVSRAESTASPGCSRQQPQQSHHHHHNQQQQQQLPMVADDHAASAVSTPTASSTATASGSVAESSGVTVSVTGVAVPSHEKKGRNKHRRDKEKAADAAMPASVMAVHSPLPATTPTPPMHAHMHPHLPPSPAPMLVPAPLPLPVGMAMSGMVPVPVPMPVPVSDNPGGHGNQHHHRQLRGGKHNRNHNAQMQGAMQMQAIPAPASAYPHNHNYPSATSYSSHAHASTPQQQNHQNGYSYPPAPVYPYPANTAPYQNAYHYQYNQDPRAPHHSQQYVPPVGVPHGHGLYDHTQHQQQMSHVQSQHVPQNYTHSAGKHNNNYKHNKNWDNAPGNAKMGAYTPMEGHCHGNTPSPVVNGNQHSSHHRGGNNGRGRRGGYQGSSVQPN